jgi:hypothetical protein
MSEQGNDNVVRGAGWACASLDGLGEGPGFRKIRGPLEVTAFGVDAPTQRRLRNLSETEDAASTRSSAGKGYVGRDGRLAEGETHR